MRFSQVGFLGAKLLLKEWQDLSSLLRVRYLLNPQDFGNLILLIILMLMCAQEPSSISCSGFVRCAQAFVRSYLVAHAQKRVRVLTGANISLLVAHRRIWPLLRQVCRPGAQGRWEKKCEIM